MTVRTVINLPAATHVETARCLFAIELSKQSWVIGFITPLSTRISRRILSGGDWKGLLKLIDEVRARVSREMGRTVEVMSCYEACSAFTRVTACTLALSPIRDTHSEGFSYFVTSIAAPVASGWSGLPGGPYTHWKAPPCHGARQQQTLTLK